MATAFTGVTVVPMDTDRVAAGQTVVVDGDRIAWLGPNGAARPPAGARLIDGRGKFLMPGLADMHAHPVDEGDLLLFLAYGVTTIRVMWGLPRHIAWRDRTARGELLGPGRIHTVGPIIDGRPVRNAWSTSVTTAQEAERAVAATKLAGHASIKVYDQLEPDVYDRLVRAAQDQGLSVVGHIPFALGLPRALAAGQLTIEHLFGYLAETQPDPRAARVRPREFTRLRPILLDGVRTARMDRLPELAEATRAAGTWNCPTLIVRGRWLDAPDELLARPEMRYLTPLRRAHTRRFTSSYPDRADAMRVVDFHGQVTKALHDAGAGLLVGTDAGIPGMVPGASVHEELAAFVAAGLTPYQALRAATAGPAAYLGAAGEVGVVATGARADLLLLDADPLADVGNAARIAGVMTGGRWHPAAELRTRLDALAADRAVADRAVDDRAAADRAAASQAATGAVPPDRRVHRRTARYRVERAGRVLGVEELTVETGAAGGRRLRTDADIEVFGFHILQGWEAGSYRSEVDVDPDGRDRRAVFAGQCLDGPFRAELVRADGQVRVRRTVPPPDLSGEAGEEVVADAGEPLFGWPLTGLYARLGARLTGLGVGERAELPMIGPGLAPDRDVRMGTVRARRLPDVPDETAGATARFAVEVERPNVRYTGTLAMAADGLPERLELDGSPPLVVTRQRSG